MMCKKLFYIMLLMLLLTIGAKVQAEVIFSDDFDHAMMDDWSRINYQGWYEQEVLGWPSPGGPWVIGNWDGYQSLPDDTGVSPTLIAQNYVDASGSGMGEPNLVPAWTPGYEGEVLNGVLRITSTNSGWADTWNSGPFLYKMVEGDFVAEVEVVAADYWWNNLGGLMARAPNDDGVGENENWVYLTYFPVYSVGNHLRDTVNGASTEAGIKGYPCNPYLRLERIGNTFYFYTSPDGQTWASLPGTFPAGHPQEGQLIADGLIRDDLPAELQVGIFQANYTGDWIGSMDFDNFVISTIRVEPEAVIVYENDYENPDANDALLGWNWGDGGIVHNVAYVDYEGNMVVEHTGVIDASAAAITTRFGSKWGITLSGNTSTDPADYTIEFDLRSVSGEWDPIDLEFFVLTGGGNGVGYGSGASPYAQADGWVHVSANLADLTAGWWAGTAWDMTVPDWQLEVGGPPWPGITVPAGTPAWDQVWLMDNLKITMAVPSTD